MNAAHIPAPLLDQASATNVEVFPPWHFDRWRAVDDRVRGGSSISHLDHVNCDSQVNSHEVSSEKESSGHSAARFWGNLDISTLGGAGFASQTFLFGPSPLHLSRASFDGLRLAVLPDPKVADDSPKNFTLVLKNTIRTKAPKEPKLPPQPEPAVLTYEASFTRPFHSHGYPASGHGTNPTHVDFGWSEFTPHYRGREIGRDDERWKPLDTDSIYEVSFMCRSGFGKQEGDFGIIIAGLEGVRKGDLSKKVGSQNWSTWLGSWWSWFWSWFSTSGRIKLDEKV